MQYVQVEIKADTDFTEIIIAELSEHDYDSFWEDDDKLIAYIEKIKYDESVIIKLQEKYWEAHLTYTQTALESKNWNQEWERNFQPIVVANKCNIRATFHSPRPEIPLEIIIDPKMAFGTGHHATTSMMVLHLLEMELEGRNVMDVGCGSGILSILASKLGATHVFGFDIDQWSVENSKENLILNQVTNVEIDKGTIIDFRSRNEHYDVILVNITRNILIEEFPLYVTKLKTSGIIIMSGFYENDIERLENAAQKLGLVKIKQSVEDGNWASIIFSFL